MNLSLLIVLALVIMFLATAIKILNEYERGVIFRLGRLIGSKGPGLIILIPIIDKMQKMSLRLVALDVPPQDVITRVSQARAGDQADVSGSNYCKFHNNYPRFAAC